MSARDDANRGDAVEGPDDGAGFDANPACSNDSFVSLANWTQSEPAPCRVTAVDGNAELQIPNEGTCLVTLTTAPRLLTGKTITVKVESVGRQEGDLQTYFELRRNDTNYVYMTVTDSTAHFVARISDVDEQEMTTPYDAVAMPYWQFRHVPSTNQFAIYTGTHGDWSYQHTLDIPTIANLPLEVQLGALRYSTGLGASISRFAEFSICPQS